MPDAPASSAHHALLTADLPSQQTMNAACLPCLLSPAESRITPEIVAEVETLDVSTAQATVPADKDMILGMIRASIGIDDMNKQVSSDWRMEGTNGHDEEWMGADST